MNNTIARNQPATRILPGSLWVLILTAAMAIPSMAMAFTNIVAGYAGAEAGDWGGKNGAAIGIPDGTCANMGAVGKVNLVSGFGFNLPDDAEITDIAAFIKSASKKGQAIGVQLAEDAVTEPPGGVTPVAIDDQKLTPPAVSGGNCALTEVVFIDGALANWGLGADPYPGPNSEVNNPEFGMVFHKLVTSEIKVDSVCMQITYESATDIGDQGCFADPEPGTLTLLKSVDNGSGTGSNVDTDWTLTATGPTPNVTGIEGAAAITDAVVTTPGVYVLTESVIAGYTLDDVTCSGGSLTDNSLSLAADESATCTFFNNDDPEVLATLTLVKQVINNDTGTALASAWTLEADLEGPGGFISGISGSGAVTSQSVDPGDYLLAESGPDGYAQTSLGCTDGTLVGSTLTLAPGDDAICTFVNNDIPPPPPPPPPDVPVPASNVWMLVLLTLALLATGWYFRPARRR
jgi:hypothetical protein